MAMRHDSRGRCGKISKLRAHVYNYKHETEQTEVVQGFSSQSPTSRSKSASPKTATNWASSVQRPETGGHFPCI